MTEQTHDLSCACGAVALRLSGKTMGPFQCYCRQCRHSSGGGPATFVMAPRASVVVTGALATYAEPTASGNHASRSFCPACGTAVYSEPGSVPQMLAIKFSIFDNAPWDAVKAAFWTDEAPSWARLDPDVPARPAG